MQITAERLKELLIEYDDGVLKPGAHNAGGRDFCAMEFIAKVAGEPWTDHPKCVHPTLAAYCRSLNDRNWPSSEARTETMLPLLAVVFGSRDLNIDSKRIAEQTIRLIVPEAMESAAKLNPKQAHKLRAAGKKCADTGTRESAQEAAAYAAAAAAYAAAAAAAAAYADAAADADAAYAAAAAADAAADADARKQKDAERIRLYKISIGIIIDEVKRAREEANKAA